MHGTRRMSLSRDISLSFTTKSAWGQGLHPGEIAMNVGRDCDLGKKTAQPIMMLRACPVNILGSF